jgi:hypothetical protein
MPRWSSLITDHLICYDSRRIPLKGSLRWWMCHLPQCARLKCAVRAKWESLCQVVAGTQSTAYDVSGVRAGGGNIRLTDWTFFNRPMSTASYSAMLETSLKPRIRYRWLIRTGIRRPHALSLSVCPRHFLTNILQASGLDRQLLHHSRSPGLNTPDNSWWVVWREEWLSIGTPPMRSCEKRLLRHFYANAPTCVKKDTEAQPLLCSSSECTYGSTGHVTMKCAGDPIVLHIAWYTATACPSCT